jgi:ABC-type transporter Mla subunit MlaD
MDKRDEQIDALTKQLAQLTQIVASVVNPSAPVQKLLQPLSSIMAEPVQAEPEMHPALKKLLETGDVVAAARVLNPERPDITKLRELATGQALREGQSDFTNMALRKGYLTQTTFTPSLPVDMPQYPTRFQS